MELNAIDLFCGCGGISLGMHKAGINVVAGVDIEENYICTFRHNFKGAKAIIKDISSSHPDVLLSEIERTKDQIDVIAGGPPCQGFSKNVPRKNRTLNSDNNRLVRTFIEYCEHIKPKIFIMENVAEMKNGFDSSYTNEIVERLSRSGYSVSYSVLHAAEYGIPQRRKRAFFVGNKFGVKLSFPSPTHVDQKNLRPLIPQNIFVSVWDAIGDLPSLQMGEGKEWTEYGSNPISSYQKLIRNGQKHVANHVAKMLKPTQYERLAALRPGQGLKDLPEYLKTNGGYSGAYGRLTEDMIAPTITRWVFHPGSGRWGHPRDIRLLTIREAARIQGFYDDFEFIGSYTQQAGQVGNAVPPLLVKQVIESVISQLRGHI